MSKESVAIKINNFMFDFDPYDYKDQETYLGSNKDDISELVNNNNFKDIKDFLKEVIQEDRDPSCTKKAKKLLKEIKQASSIQR